MLIKTEDLKHLRIIPEDKVAVSLYDLYFDDLFWSIQYLVLTQIERRQKNALLILRNAAGEPDFNSGTWNLYLTLGDAVKGQKTGKYRGGPVSGGPTVSGILKWPLKQVSLTSTEFKKLTTGIQGVPDGADFHLRSRNNVLGYNFHAKNGEIGHVKDLVIETASWKIRYLIIDTRNWLYKGTDVLISPTWIEKIRWSEQLIYVDFNKEVVQNSPAYNPEKPLGDDLELKLNKYYGHQRSKK